jgi:hypothetical protein
MGINRIRLQNGAMGDPRVDARMQQTYQENIRRNNAERTLNQMSRNYDFSGLSTLGLNPKTYDSTPGPMRGIPAVGGMREKMIQDIMNKNQPYSLTPPKPPEPTDSLTEMPEPSMLPNMNPSGNMMSLTEANVIRDKVLAAQAAQEEQYYLTDPISGKQYKSEQEAIDDLGIVTYNQRFATGGRVGFQDGSPEEMVKAQEAAASDPALDAIRQQLFGEDYVQDIGEGRGIAQYYTGFGLPQSLQFTPPAAVEEAAPVVDITQPVVDSGGGGGGGSDIDITTPDTGNTDFEQNLLDQGIGVQAEQGISPISAPGEGMLTQQAIDELADYPLNTSYGVGGVDGMSGGEATPGAEFADQNPYGGTGTMDDLGADSFPEYQEPTVATYGDTTTGLEGYLDGIDLSTGRAETIDTRADEPPSLGFGNAPEADIYRDPIMDMANMNQADVIASDANVGFDTPEQTKSIGDAFNSVKDLGAAGVDKFKDSLIALGGKVKEGFDNTIEIGGKTIDLTKSLIGGALSFATGIPGISFALNAIKEDPMQAATKQGLEEQGYGFDDIGRLTTGPMAGYNVESAFGDGISKTTLDRIDKIENRDAPQTEASIKKVQELYNFLGDVTEVKAAETAPQEDIGAIFGNRAAEEAAAAQAAKDLEAAIRRDGGGNKANRSSNKNVSPGAGNSRR